MGKRLLIVLGLVVLSLASQAAAIYTPNPAGRWRAGSFSLLGDFQYNSKDLDSGPHDLDMYGFFVRPSFSPARNVSLYGRLGFQGADSVDVGFAGGFGIQGAYEIPSAPEWAVGGAFDFVYWTADFEHSDANIKWAEFQLTPAVSYAIPSVPGLVPYAGILLDFVEARGDIEQDDPVGLLLGTTYDINGDVRVEAQFRVISENGVFLSGGVTF